MLDHRLAASTGGLTKDHAFRFSSVQQTSAHAGSRTRVTSMGGLYDAATLHVLLAAPQHSVEELLLGDNRSSNMQPTARGHQIHLARIELATFSVLG